MGGIDPRVLYGQSVIVWGTELLQGINKSDLEAAIALVARVLREVRQFEPNSFL